MRPEVLQVIESKIKDLPTLPSVAMHIIEVSRNPEATVEELKAVISGDLVVSARVMKLVNSAYFGFPRQISSLSKAIVILGFNNVRALAMSVSIMDMYRPRAGKQRLNYQELWKHTVGAAAASRALALNAMPRAAEQCFMAGLLHDIGVIVLDQSFPNEYAAVLRYQEEKQAPLYVAEQAILGYTHAEVGGFVCEKWLLPPALVQAIAGHHDPGMAEDTDKTILIAHTADIITKMRGFGDFGDNAYYTLDSIHPDARLLFHVKEDFPPGILEFVNAEFQEAERLLAHIS